MRDERRSCGVDDKLATVVVVLPMTLGSKRWEIDISYIYSRREISEGK